MAPLEAHPESEGGLRRSYTIVMCGRYILVARAKQLAAYYKISLEEAIELALFPKARFNIAPSQSLPLFRIAPETGAPELAVLKWGLVPSWSKSSKPQYSTINAMAETIDTKPAFRAAFRNRRCLIPMTGFYEWRKMEDGTKQPYVIRHTNEPLLSAAGIWEHWEKEGEVVDSFSIITTSANETMRPLHSRMPVFLAPEDFAAWMSLGEPAHVRTLLRPCPDSWLATYPVSKLVNNPRNESPQCLEPLPSA